MRVVTHRGEAARHLVAAGRRREAAATALEALWSHDAPRDPRERAALLVIAAEASPASAAWTCGAGRSGPRRGLGMGGLVIRVLDGGAARGSAELLAEREALLAHAAFALGDLARSRALLAAAGAIHRSGIRGRRPADDQDRDVHGQRRWRLLRGPGCLEAALAAPAAAARRAVWRSALGDSVLAAPSPADVAIVQAAAGEAFEEGRYRTAIDRTRVVQYLLLLGTGRKLPSASSWPRSLASGRPGSARGLDFQADAVAAACLAGNFDASLALADELLEQPAPARARQTAEIYRARALAMLGRVDEAERALGDLIPRRAPTSLGGRRPGGPGGGCPRQRPAGPGP